MDVRPSQQVAETEDVMPAAKETPERWDDVGALRLQIGALVQQVQILSAHVESSNHVMTMQLGNVQKQMHVLQQQAHTFTQQVQLLQQQSQTTTQQQCSSALLLGQLAERLQQVGQSQESTPISSTSSATRSKRPGPRDRQRLRLETLAATSASEAPAAEPETVDLTPAMKEALATEAAMEDVSRYRGGVWPTTDEASAATEPKGEEVFAIAGTAIEAAPAAMQAAAREPVTEKVFPTVAEEVSPATEEVLAGSDAEPATKVAPAAETVTDEVHPAAEVEVPGAEPAAEEASPVAEETPLQPIAAGIAFTRQTPTASGDSEIPSMSSMRTEQVESPVREAQSASTHSPLAGIILAVLVLWFAWLGNSSPPPPPPSPPPPPPPLPAPSPPPPCRKLCSGYRWSGMEDYYEYETDCDEKCLYECVLQ